MTLIRSISGIRGTIGGRPGDALTPLDVARYALAFAENIRSRGGAKCIIGRDARTSGEMVHHLVVGNLMGMGIDVVDLGMATTPTVEMAVIHEQADAGIILTASHNPGNWNALKLLNERGEFLSAADGRRILEIADRGNYEFPAVEDLGSYRVMDDYLQRHIDHIIDLPYVDAAAIGKAGFRVVVDAVNSVGGVAVPALLKALGAAEVVELNCEPTGIFAHNPEPLPEHITDLCGLVRDKRADIGIVVDPDADRLALVCASGEPMGEEYTLVAAADYMLGLRPGSTVSNLSSSRALTDLTESYGCRHHMSAVGELNVVEKMKQVDAVIGGEGNGGVILPDLHYGRDALVGIALILSHMANSGKSLEQLRSSYPDYHIHKDKVSLSEGVDIDLLISNLSEKYADRNQDRQDGLKIYFDKDWAHLRRSNTEPIIRIYAESRSEKEAAGLAGRIKNDIGALVR